MRAIQQKEGARQPSRGIESDFRFLGAEKRVESKQPEQIQAKHQESAVETSSGLRLSWEWEVGVWETL